MEVKVFQPLMVNCRLLACMADYFTVYVERELQAQGYPELLIAVIEGALLGTVQDEDKREHEDEVENLYLPRILAEKIFRYYSGATLNDFVRHIVRTLRQDQNFQKSLAFRQLILTKKLQKQLQDSKAIIDKEKKKKKYDKKKVKKAAIKKAAESAESKMQVAITGVVSTTSSTPDVVNVLGGGCCTAVDEGTEDENEEEELV